MNVFSLLQFLYPITFEVQSKILAYTIFFVLIFIAPACSRVRYRRPIFCPSVRQSVRPSVNIYVDVRHLCQS